VFERLNAEEEAATDGDRRHLLQKTEPKEPKEVCTTAHACTQYWVACSIS
jgi:hypothetical protein